MAKTLDSDYDRAGVCYRIAYLVIPELIYGGDPLRLLRPFAGDPGAAARRLYEAACAALDVEPCAADRDTMEGRAGPLGKAGGGDGEGHVTCAIGYPRFALPRFDQLPDGVDPVRHAVLAPHFSAVVFDDATARVARYYVLGTSPGGGTTMRRVSATVNANLGPGCEASFDAFLRDVEARLRDPSRDVAVAAIERGG